jgi:hypothetical protein
MKCSIRIAFALSTLLGGFFVAAQTTSQPPQDQTPLGSYARNVRKDPSAKPKPKVFDNDNLPTEDKLSVVGPPAATDAGNNPASGSGDKNAASGENKETTKPAGEDDQAKKLAAWKVWQDKLTAQRDQIELMSRELDVLQREYQLRAAAMYADVGNRMRNSAQWDKQEADYKQKIADKQKAVTDAKQKLEDMEEEARKDGVPAAMREP